MLQPFDLPRGELAKCAVAHFLQDLRRMRPVDIESAIEKPCTPEILPPTVQLRCARYRVSGVWIFVSHFKPTRSGSSKFSMMRVVSASETGVSMTRDRSSLQAANSAECERYVAGEQASSSRAVVTLCAAAAPYARHLTNRRTGGSITHSLVGELMLIQSRQRSSWSTACMPARNC